MLSEEENHIPICSHIRVLLRLYLDTDLHFFRQCSRVIEKVSNPDLGTLVWSGPDSKTITESKFPQNQWHEMPFQCLLVFFFDFSNGVFKFLFTILIIKYLERKMKVSPHPLWKKNKEVKNGKGNERNEKCGKW